MSGMKPCLPPDLCIGCGICRAACPVGCISMVRKGGMARPQVDGTRCLDCGLCSQACPQDGKLLGAMARSVVRLPNPRLYGVSGGRAFLAWAKDAGRRRSASGGIATAMALKLLASEKIAGVVHVKRRLAGRGAAHYEVTVSTSREEIETGRGSAYETLDFSDALLSLSAGKTYFITGTPCVLRGIRRLLADNPHYKGIRAYLCALVCSHNVTSDFADCFADLKHIPRRGKYYVDWRDKDGISDAGAYNSRIYTEDGDLFRQNRYASGWTELWRSYAFSPKACSYCSDFWGDAADMCVKDAWGRKEWTADPLGKSVVVFKNDVLQDVFATCDIEKQPLAESDLAVMQLPQTAFKMLSAENKVSYGVMSAVNLRNGLLARRAVSSLSRLAYRVFGAKATLVLVRLLIKMLPDGVRPKRDRRRLGNRLILVAGGYGNGNAGDEAQCAETLRLLAQRYPDFQIRCLTPKPDYSFGGHPRFAHDYASRVMLFNQGRPHNWYRLSGKIRKLGFLLVGFWTLFNARLVKRDRCIWFLNARKAAFLQQLSQASLFFFCGGGYLTGATKSRLWEATFICRLCRVFDVPVVMSGHTVGEWQGRLDRWLAKWGFRDVRAITVRDNEASLRDLAEIGLAGPHVFATHDDALFCAKSDERQNVPNRYVAVNFHFWGMKQRVQAQILERLHMLFGDVRLRLGNLPLVFIPMHISDMKSFEEYVRLYPEDGLVAFDYDYDFRKVRRVIADAELLLTMKHHPIIFAVGEDTPVVSMAYSDYYVHKNFGALQQYGVEACSMDLAGANWREDFAAALGKALDHVWFVRSVCAGKDAARARKDRFLQHVDAAVRVHDGRS